MARLKVAQDMTVQAKLRPLDNTVPKLELKTLAIYGKGLDIRNLDDIKLQVEHTVKTLDAKNVEATFTYGTETTPQKLDVKVDKKRLDDGETVVMLNVPPVEGLYQAWNQKVKITRKEPPAQGGDIPGKCEVEAIEVALITLKGRNISLEDYTPLENFKGENSGPYAAKDAKTAYAAVRVKVKKPNDGDYEVSVTNTNTYMEPVKLVRGTDKDIEYLVHDGGDIVTNVREHSKGLILSKGSNILEIKVKSPDGSKEGTYVVALNYDGGPDQSKKKIIAGVYCPAQRRPLEGEKPDFVWAIRVAGW